MSSRIAKRSSNCQNTQGVDHISKLPNSVLSHILSFLSTNDAVRTRVLSRRWKYVWTEISVLEIIWRCNARLGKTQQKIYLKNFVGEALLVGRSTCINKFSFGCVRDLDLELLDAWFASQPFQAVEEITLSNCHKCLTRSAKLPSRIFAFQKLCDLRLQDLNIENAHSIVQIKLPNLKRLVMKHVRVSDNDFMTRLLGGCTVLDELNIGDCHFDSIHILVPTLKRLTLQSSGSFQSIILDVPNLVCLSVTCESGTFVNSRMPLLSQAHLSYSFMSPGLLNTITETRKLSLHCQYTIFLGTNLPSLPSFHQLTNLELHVSDSSVYTLLPVLIICRCNSLQTLILTGDCPSSCRWENFSNVPKCLVSSLEVMEFSSSMYCEGQLRMLEYILTNGKVLKRVKVGVAPYLSLEHRFQLAQKLLFLPRASNVCRIIV